MKSFKPKDWLEQNYEDFFNYIGDCPVKWNYK